MLRLLILLLFSGLLLAGCAGHAPQESIPADQRETVVLLHGLGRSTQAMYYLQYRLEHAGFEVFNIGYPSREKAPEELVRLLHDRVRICCAAKKKVHFVAHSLGGVMVLRIAGRKAGNQPGQGSIAGNPEQGDGAGGLAG